MTSIPLGWHGRFTWGFAREPEGVLNALTYGGVDFIIKGLSGVIAQPKITHIYMRFGAPVPGISGIEQATAQLFRDNAGGAGCLFVPLLSPPTLATSQEGAYESNQAVFEYAIGVDHAVGDTTGIWASNANFATNQQIYALGVVSAQHYNDRSQDILLAAADITADNLQLSAGTIHSGNYTVTLTP